MSQENIRNIVIIAHIDHGKSTLADRFLELTGTVEKRKMREQYLDRMDLERERGITIKLQPVRMTYNSSQTDTDFTRTGTDNRTQTNTDNKIPTDVDHKARTNTDKLLHEDLTYKIRGAVFEVRKKLGSGHKESVYHNALKLEFEKRHLPFESEKVINVVYDDKKVGVYTPDFLIDGKVIIELKSLPYIGDPIKKQVWNYLKGGPYELALLVNFGPDGAEIERIIDSPKKKSQSLSVSSPLQSVYQLNLIDTPGHVDFTYEVSRSLAAVEGAVLVVDATQGIQAQTLANVNLALEHKLKIIPVVNKIDLAQAEPEKVAAEIKAAFGFADDEILFVSAKTGEGVEEILKRIVRDLPAPKGKADEPLRALIFDSAYDKHRGVVTYVRVVSGQLKTGEAIKMMGSGAEGTAQEVGHFSPDLTPDPALGVGEIGYIVTGLREVELARVGDTITTSQRQSASSQRVSALPGYREVKPMVYASIFPAAGDDYPLLRDAMAKLKLNDASLSFEPENIPSIGFGFRCGFLGLLHLEIIQERLIREFDLDIVITSPSVAYKVRKTDDTELTIYNPSSLPEQSQIKTIAEPWMKLLVLTPSDYLGHIMELVRQKRGLYKSTEYLGAERLRLHFEIPLPDLISDFYDKLKSVSSGYASMNYEFLEYREADLVKVDILVAGEKVEALSFMTQQDRAADEGRAVVEKLKELLPRQQFAVALQAAVGGRIIARETIPALRKDVTAKLYGGDVTRKMKLLKKQKKGKRRLKKIGQVEIPQKAFLALLKR